MSCSLSSGSLRPFDRMRNKAADVARRIVRLGSGSNVNKRGIVIGVTVRLISIHPWNNYQLIRRESLWSPNNRIPAYEPNVLIPQSTISIASESSGEEAVVFLSAAIRSIPSITIVNTASLINGASRSRTASLTRESRVWRTGLNVLADLIVWSATSPEISVMT